MPPLRELWWGLSNACNMLFYRPWQRAGLPGQSRSATAVCWRAEATLWKALKDEGRDTL